MDSEYFSSTWAKCPRFENIHYSTYERYDNYHTDGFEDHEYEVPPKIFTKKQSWSKKKNGFLEQLYDETIVVMKKLALLPQYHDKVTEIDLLKETYTDESSTDCPKRVSMFLPLVHIRTEHSSEAALLNCQDCRLIINIAKRRFKPGDHLPGYEKHYHYFHFGQRVVDVTNDTMMVVVGETYKFVYVISQESVMEDVNGYNPILPFKRAIEYVSKTRTKKALNFEAVEECAKMANYVESYAERVHLVYSREPPFFMVGDD